MPTGEEENEVLSLVLTNLLASCGIEAAAERSAALIAEFHTLPAVLAASPEALTRVAGGDGAVARCLGAVRAAMLHALKADTVGRSIFSSADKLIGYLRVALAGATEEQLRVLFLNARNELLRDELAFPGSATGVAIRPRPILKRALELGATAIILVHNHPSGDPTPSDEDVRATSALAAAAGPLEIVVHDHIIVGGRSWTSLASNGLMRRAA
ncbi:MAG: DNA repair protein RadC [Sphingomonadaceae bacterium]|nr:DNA repair protein RadC [Sphingomonadaceae bacterium]